VDVARLEMLFRSARVEPVSAASAAYEGLRREHETRVEAIVERRLRDVWIADHLARTMRLELSLYGDLVPLARVLEADDEPLVQARAGVDQAIEELDRVQVRLYERLAAASRSPAAQRP